MNHTEANKRKRDYRRWRRELRIWRSPEELSAELERCWKQHGDHLLTDGAAQFWRDAYVGQKFGRLLDAEAVRLCDGERPDFEVRAAGIMRAYEVTEAMMLERKRTDELNQFRERGDTGDVEHVPQDDFLPLAGVAEALRARAAGKNDGRYHAGQGLVIYLNPGFVNAEAEEVESVLAEGTAAARDRFGEVWVLWEGAAFNTWMRGARPNADNAVLRPASDTEDTEVHTPTPLSEILRRPLAQQEG